MRIIRESYANWVVGGVAIAADCKSAVRKDFGGAIPSPPTIKIQN